MTDHHASEADHSTSGSARHAAADPAHQQPTRHPVAPGGPNYGPKSRYLGIGGNRQVRVTADRRRKRQIDVLGALR
jgi:hypothetical protein